MEDFRQILVFLTKLWLVLVSQSTSVTPQPVALHRRELAAENPGFISIDCGADGDYTDEKTVIFYKSDKDFVSIGKNQDVSPEFAFENSYTGRQLNNLRTFPEGRKNCYTLQPEQGKNHNYLIRAFFKYGNYDAKNSTPKFDLYLGVNYWGTLKLQTSYQWIYYEIINFSMEDTIYVCLVNTGLGIPFISSLELRHLNDSIYRADSESLIFPRRYDIRNPTGFDARFQDDVYDRMWSPYWQNEWDFVSTSLDIDNSDDPYKVPADALKTAAQAPNETLNSLNYSLNSSYSHLSDYFYVNFYFAEIREIARAKKTEFVITLNGNNYGPFKLEYCKQLTVQSNKTSVLSGETKVYFSISPTTVSDLRPILNAFEILVYPLPLSSTTDTADAEAIIAAKQVYGIKRGDWQGDPCMPKDFSWSGLSCSYADKVPRIISLNLSSSKLTGEIDTSLSNLKELQSLDLSNNELTGTVPEFLAQLSNLKFLNLTGNRLTGPIPPYLLEKSEKGNLQLSVDVNSNPCQGISCKKKKHSFLLPIAVSVVSVLALVLLCITVFLWRRRRQEEAGAESRKEASARSKNQFFTYSEIVTITRNFINIIGQGGFGKVYLGSLKDGTQVAVKLLSQSSKQGYKEFQSEVRLLMLVYHRNLVSLVGYCDEQENKALVYEYMANGNLRQHLSDSSTNVLSWRDRLRIAVDAAHGLEYLHNGCRPPIIHRDMKSSNILLDENFLAKISDFGLSRVYATDTDTHVNTRPAGTFGYVDPQFLASGNLNKKSDVYSFGVILFELITGLPVVIKGQETNTHILQWIGPIIQSGDINGIVDSRLQDEFNTNSAWKAVEIAMSCVPPTAIQRPDINNVLAELKECLAIEMDSGRPIRTHSNVTASNNLLEMSFPSAR